MSGEKLISLKEASKISGYSADYIGQLIRSGKIKGEKVYCQITWMTTKEEVLNYKNGGGENDEKSERQKKSSYSNYLNRIKAEIRFFKLFLSHIRGLLPYLVIFAVSIITLSFFLLDNIFNNPSIKSISQEQKNAIVSY